MKEAPAPTGDRGSEVLETMPLVPRPAVKILAEGMPVGVARLQLTKTKRAPRPEPFSVEAWNDPGCERTVVGRAPRQIGRVA